VRTFLLDSLQTRDIGLENGNKMGIISGKNDRVENSTTASA